MMREILAGLPRLPLLESLSNEQLTLLEEYTVMLREMNRRINLVSREDAGRIPSLHIPHVLALTLRAFPGGATVVDWGTGGGLPAIPLAIVFPGIAVYAVDAVEKKVLAVRTMARRLGLANLRAWSGQAAQWPGEAEYSVSRATAPLADLWGWHRRVAVQSPVVDGAWKPGLICLKGGDLDDEVAALHRLHGSDLAIDMIPIGPYYENPLFDSKYLVHVTEAAS